ncbi:stringent starvation protein B [Suttonella ornithocola]|uniref:Stringent starvation protein B n=1 Tax=Suttonella ornithocola TaxID=279832 RepID=A0A380MZD4_9GAMM|nr:ClpXP protease specificity-enhancing factor SspB [Suttonella ornithocola]SUO97263.1 Stringent starvation protein B [Suttonella ornithocola]
MNEITMTDQKPYLLRAIYQWIIDNNCTPHLVIAYPKAGWVSGVPNQFLENDTLVLNISPTASPDITIENEVIYFSTRFSGTPHNVSVLIESVVGLFAKETQQGMGFDVSPNLENGPKKLEKFESLKKTASHLKVIK